MGGEGVEKGGETEGHIGGGNANVTRVNQETHEKFDPFLGEGCVHTTRCTRATILDPNRTFTAGSGQRLCLAGPSNTNLELTLLLRRLSETDTHRTFANNKTTPCWCDLVFLSLPLHLSLSLSVWMSVCLSRTLSLLQKRTS